MHLRISPRLWVGSGGTSYKSLSNHVASTRRRAKIEREAISTSPGILSYTEVCLVMSKVSQLCPHRLRVLLRQLYSAGRRRDELGRLTDNSCPSNCLSQIRSRAAVKLVCRPQGRRGPPPPPPRSPAPARGEPQENNIVSKAGYKTRLLSPFKFYNYDPIRSWEELSHLNKMLLIGFSWNLMVDVAWISDEACPVQRLILNIKLIINGLISILIIRASKCSTPEPILLTCIKRCAFYWIPNCAVFESQQVDHALGQVAYMTKVTAMDSLG